MSAEEYEAYKLSSSNEYSGIGLSVKLNDSGEFEVFSVEESSPAASAGIAVGDLITAIDGDHPSFETVRVAAHSYDCNCRPLSSYKISAARFIHIDGIRSMQPLEVPEEQEQ